MFYEQLLRVQIRIVYKDTDNLTEFVCFGELWEYKLHVNMLMKLTPFYPKVTSLIA
jgi:hypothetical protein